MRVRRTLRDAVGGEMREGKSVMCELCRLRYNVAAPAELESYFPDQ